MLKQCSKRSDAGIHSNSRRESPSSRLKNLKIFKERTLKKTLVSGQNSQISTKTFPFSPYKQPNIVIHNIIPHSPIIIIIILRSPSTTKWQLLMHIVKLIRSSPSYHKSNTYTNPLKYTPSSPKYSITCQRPFRNKMSNVYTFDRRFYASATIQLHQKLLSRRVIRQLLSHCCWCANFINCDGNVDHHGEQLFTAQRSIQSEGTSLLHISCHPQE